MKDSLTPVGTPFALSNAPNTPSKLCSNHYFAPAHHLSGVQICGQESAGVRNGVEETRFEKFQFLEVPRARSVLDSIPNELLSLVLEFGYFDYCEGPSPNAEFRWSWLQTSRRFRQVTLHTPSVWSVIHLSHGNVGQEIDQLPLYLERSMDYPLDIQLSCFWSADITDAIMDQLIPHTGRWRRLSIVTMNAYILSFLQHTAVPILEDLDIAFYSHVRRTSLPSPFFRGRTPRLLNLCLRNVNLDDLDISFQGLKTLDIRGYGTWPILSQLNEMIGGSTSLERLVLHVKPGQVTQQLYQEQPDNHREMQIHLPNLRLFDVYTSEWLSSRIVSLIHVFACPKLQSFTLCEDIGTASQNARTIMSYTTASLIPKNTRLPFPLGEPMCTGFPNRLFVQCASVNLACQALFSTTLTSLELRKISLPVYGIMKATFAGLKNLKHLFFLDIHPNGALLQMLDNIEPASFQEPSIFEMESTILIPSLETLIVDFNHVTSTFLPKDYSAEFLRVFSLPSLRSLILKNMKSIQWKAIADSFSYHSQYPHIVSLKLIDMTDIVPTDPNHSLYTDIASAFPRLRRLSLDSVRSNAFIQQLLPHPNSPNLSINSSDNNISSLPWPALEVLAICNDANVSKPLLHRVITTRVKIGKALLKLCLDDHFSRNLESWEWIVEHVEVAQAETGYI